MLNAYLLIDHGSRRAESNAQLEDMAQRVRSRRPGALVAVAHMEIAAPSIADGIATLVAAGAIEITALLYFLSDGRHSREDVPKLVAEAVAAHPGVTARCAPALGPHDLLADLLLLRGDQSFT